MAAKMYFVAVMAPSEINEKVLKWKHYMRDEYGCAVALRSPAHITLVAPFWMPEELESGLRSDLEAFSETRSSFEIRLNGFDAFKPRVIFVNVEEGQELSRLKIDVENFIESRNKYPMKKELRPFHPHVTLANRDLLKKDFPKAFEYFQKIRYQQAFDARSIALLKHTAGRWEVVKEFNFSN